MVLGGGLALFLKRKNWPMMISAKVTAKTSIMRLVAAGLLLWDCDTQPSSCSFRSSDVSS